MNKCDFCYHGTPNECPWNYASRRGYCKEAIERMIETLIKIGGKINV